MNAHFEDFEEYHAQQIFIEQLHRIQSEAKCSHVIYIQYRNQDLADFLGLLCFLSDGHSLILTYSPFIQHSICKDLVQVYHVQVTQAY